MLYSLGGMALGSFETCGTKMRKKSGGEGEHKKKTESGRRNIEFGHARLPLPQLRDTVQVRRCHSDPVCLSEKMRTCFIEPSQLRSEKSQREQSTTVAMVSCT